jgi:DNA excision repair protein ERCC-2
LQEFFRLAGRGGGVLTGVSGGKLAEGIDYKGEALNGVAVVGLPLAAYDEIQKEINGYYTRKYGRAKGMLIAYTLPAVNRGLQAAGRVIRSESERGVILFCDRRFGDNSPGSVNEFLPDWVREDLILVDAKEGREIILKKVADWKMDKPHLNKSPPSKTQINANQEMLQMPRRSRATNPGKRDLRELAKALGLGKEKSAAKTAAKPDPKSSRKKN